MTLYLTVVLVLILLALLVGILLGIRHTDESLCQLRVRIKELGDKSTQLLTFLSFALAVVVILESGPSPLQASQKLALAGAMRSWVCAIFPVVVGILPLKEFRSNNTRWYSIVRWFKFALLWAAIGIIVLGAIQFYYAVACYSPAYLFPHV